MFHYRSKYNLCTILSFRIVEVFLMKDVSCVRLPGFNEEPPLHYAVRGGHLDTVQLILEYEPDVNARFVLLLT